MKNFAKIAGINLGILVIYNILVRIASGHHDVLGNMMTLCFLIIIQVMTNGITASVYYGSKKKELGNSYMLSAVLVAIIGFAACTAIP